MKERFSVHDETCNHLISLNWQDQNYHMHLSFQKTFFVLASLIALVFILHIASALLIPITYALLISLILFPLVRWLIRKRFSIVWAIITTMLSVVILISGIIFFFSSQIIHIAGEYDNFVEKLNDLYLKIIVFLNEKVRIIPEIEPENIKEVIIGKVKESGMPLVSDTLNFTSTFLSFLVLTIIYIFLILLHHRQFAHAITQGAAEERREHFYSTLKKAQNVGQQYLTGMGTLMLILGVLNTTGLLILGIDYAFFFGFLAAILAIIPYIGTTLGGLIPTLYAFMTYESYWYALGVILIFWFIQFIEGNFLSPKIIGGNLNLNAMTALVALISGGFLWGISGMILFLPLAAIFKVFCENFEELKPVSMLMGGSTSSKSESLLSKIKRKVRKK